MIKDVVTDPLLLIGASAAAATNWIAQVANPFVALLAGIGGLAIIGLTIAEKLKKLRMMDMKMKREEEEQNL